VEVDAGLDEVRAQAAFRQLQSSPVPGDGVVVDVPVIDRQHRDVVKPAYPWLSRARQPDHNDPRPP
jgi:hypothetical protein